MTSKEVIEQCWTKMSTSTKRGFVAIGCDQELYTSRHGHLSHKEQKGWPESTKIFVNAEHILSIFGCRILRKQLQ
jgi:hypothetical protein